MSDIRLQVQTVIENQTGFGEDVDHDERLREFDGLDYMQLACELQEWFEVEVSDVHLETLKTVDRIAHYIESLVEARTKVATA